jgi:predicted nucleotidyltransferase component of viral defense system
MIESDALEANFNDRGTAAVCEVPFANVFTLPIYLESRTDVCRICALYQRKAGRDLFDLAIALTDGKANPERVVSAFLQYMDHEGHKITPRYSRRISPSKCKTLHS